MRAIDGDALKRKAQKVATEAWKMKLTAKIETTLNQFIDWIDKQPTVQSEPQWILCSDRLPDKEDLYIVTIQCEHVDGWDDYVTSFAEWDVDDWHLVSYYPGQIKAVAWMPLPEPYKGMNA